MTVLIALKALALWFAILVLAFLNGTLREFALIPALGKSPGLITSGLLLSVTVLLVAWFGAPGFGRMPAGIWWRVGAFWLALTLTFEFGFGIIRHLTWDEMFAAYSFKDGNLWSLVLLVVLVAPRAAARRRGLD